LLLDDERLRDAFLLDFLRLELPLAEGSAERLGLQREDDR
jgi:hypothetical protein